MNINLETITYEGRVPFLDSGQVRYIRGAVTLDHTAVVADANGMKKIKAGSFIGKSGGKWKKYTAGVKAAVTLQPGGAGGNNDITVTAKNAGAAGNSIKVQLKNPGVNSQALKVLLESDTIVVSLATDAAGTITSTAAQVIAAINAALYVKDLVTASNAAGSDGTGVVAAVNATPLAGGTNANVVPTLILADDVTFTKFNEATGLTHADQVATAIDQARVIAARLPEQPDDYVKQNMPGITWA